MKKPTNKREQSATRKILAASRTASAATELPAGPYWANGDLNASGLLLIERASLAGNTRARIASYLGISTKKLNAQIEKEDSPAASAWQRGDGEFESALLRTLNNSALVLHNSESAKFILRTRGFRESGTPTTEIKNAIQFILPGCMSSEEYYAKLGITHAIETRTPATRAAQDAAMGRVPALLDAPRIEVDHHPRDTIERVADVIEPTPEAIERARVFKSMAEQTNEDNRIRNTPAAQEALAAMEKIQRGLIR
jgi:hypothetical protein